MMTIAAALGAPVLLGAMPVAAQVTSVAVADPAEAILSANALNTANTQIATTYKAQIDQVVARQQQLQTQLTAMLKPIDTNNDGQISDAELAVAQNAKNPV
ncbi:MAG: OmpH family outer membrane protein, partial [Sphingomonas sp.]